MAGPDEARRPREAGRVLQRGERPDHHGREKVIGFRQLAYGIHRRGKVVTAANEPILNRDERVIGFRQLEYRAYRGGLVRSPLMDERGGWVWQTTKRVLHLDDKWEELPTGVKGKRVHEYGFMEVADVLWQKRAVTVVTQGPEGKVLWEYKPFGAAARLFGWLREQREERKRFAKGEVKPVYERPSG